MKDKTLYMIGNAHLDVVWLWNWQEGLQEVKATFQSALDRMNEDPDFIFSCSSASYYEWVELNCPKMFEQIKVRVAEGRWELVGGWWTQPDCNIPCGESFVRQGLYGQNYFLEKFGKTAMVGYNVDSFGHNGMLPQILKKSGLDRYVFMRPMPLEKGLPGRVFNWRSADGSEVLTYRIPYEYCSGRADLRKNADRLLCELKDGPASLMLFYGVGNHGGGPTKENIRSIHEMNDDPTLPTFKMSRVDSFFKDVENNIFPTVTDDLQHHASGCYSVNSAVKRDNMTAEQALMTAERWSTITTAIGALGYPADLTLGWKNTLFNQFHDILAGTSIHTAYRDSGYAYGEAISIGERNINNAIQAITWDIDIPMDTAMRPIVVCNAHMWEASLPVELEVRGLKDDCFRLEDSEGNIIPAQRVTSEATVNGQSRLLFVAKLPSLGYATFKLFMGLEAAPAYVPVRVTDTTLENDRYKVTFNPATGNMSSLWDKVAELEVLRREGARLCVIEDKTDTWSHNVFKFDKLLGEMKPVYVRKIEEGAVRSTIRVRSKYGESYVTQDFRLYATLPSIEVKTTIDWREEQTMLKLKYPVCFNFRRPTIEIPYGHIEKSGNGEEEAGQGFIDMQGEHFKAGKMYGLALLNDSKFSYSMEIDEMCITLLKNSVFAHHDPKELEPTEEYRFLERGVQELTYAILPHTGNWKDCGLSKRAQELKRRAIPIIETYHSGSQPQVRSFASIDHSEITLTVLKQSENGLGVIVRGYETTGNTVNAVLDLGLLGRTIPLQFAPYEIKTVYVPYDIAKPYAETDMLER